MYEQVFLPMDGPPLAVQAIPHAVIHAEQFNAELVLVNFLEPLAKSINLPQRAARKAGEEPRKLAYEYLERLAAGIRDKGVSVRVVTLTGSPHVEIAKFTEIEKIGLVVISTRGQSGLSRRLMGSVAARVVRNVNVPVLLI